MDYYLITAVVTNSYFYFQVCFTDPSSSVKTHVSMKEKENGGIFYNR